MPEKFTDIEAILNSDDVLEIDSAENVMKGKLFLKAVEKVREEIVSHIKSEVDSLLDDEAIALQRLDDSSEDAITYEIKVLSSDSPQQGWQTKKVRFRFAIEACTEEVENPSFQSPLDDIRQSIQPQ
ncbi:MAG: KGK domain-containing protein [Limnothrix sp.]